ncbi:hypothetical protein Taro_043270 [Colocasia esculenta]|uniref:Nucleotide-diphospho-sugar transferase domain-containing protein n=1 Tax=Colocasia esculenta TaxID=4460 RepID=A0A843X159_COLES|nr:hypothetical protein [Colocasia esculenta]
MAATSAMEGKEVASGSAAAAASDFGGGGDSDDGGDCGSSLLSFLYSSLCRERVDLYLLPQAAFPTGGLYFKNQTWVQQTKGTHVIIHNNYITGFEKKIKRFRDFGLWLVDDHIHESPLGRL